MKYDTPVKSLFYGQLRPADRGIRNSGIANYCEWLGLRALLQILKFSTFYATIKHVFIKIGSPKAYHNFNFRHFKL